MKQKLLILGGSGFVGNTIINYAKDDYDVIYSYNKNKFIVPQTTSFQLDLLCDDFEKIITSYDPDILIHTVAHSSVDLCENNHEIANQLHVEVTQRISKICKNLNTKMIFLSTDAVFEGQLNKLYDEDDIPNPVNFYGKTKLEAEKIVLNSSKKNIVLRTSVIYGWHEKSRFTNWILNYLKEGRCVDPFSDQYNTPTLVNDLAKAILKIIKTNTSGLFHATGKTCLNRYEFATLLAKAFSYNLSLIQPVTKFEKKQDAPRPISTCLNSKKLEQTINYSFSDIHSGINFLHTQSKTN
jgi:dTDP-4-dehydrorhamnose reductase